MATNEQHLYNEREYMKSLIKDVWRCISEKTLTQSSLWLYDSVVDVATVYSIKNPDDKWICDMVSALKTYLANWNEIYERVEPAKNEITLEKK